MGEHAGWGINPHSISPEWERTELNYVFNVTNIGLEPAYGVIFECFPPADNPGTGPTNVTRVWANAIGPQTIPPGGSIRYEFKYTFEDKWKTVGPFTFNFIARGTNTNVATGVFTVDYPGEHYVI